MSTHTCQALAQAERFQPFTCSAQIKAALLSPLIPPSVSGSVPAVPSESMAPVISILPAVVIVHILCVCCTCISVFRGLPWRCRLQRLELCGE